MSHQRTAPVGTPPRVKLLIDHQERNRSKIFSQKMLVNALNRQIGEGSCEVRNKLPAGDYMWVFIDEKGQERVLDCVVERKSQSDLPRSAKVYNTKSSMSRLRHQIEEMQATGLIRLIFLLEQTPFHRAEIALEAARIEIIRSKGPFGIVDKLKRLHEEVTASLWSTPSDLSYPTLEEVQKRVDSRHSPEKKMLKNKLNLQRELRKEEAAKQTKALLATKRSSKEWLDSLVIRKKVRR